MKTAAVFLQSACLQHRYIRSSDLSTIVERPERLRAVNIGLAAAIAHLEDAHPSSQSSATDELVAALGSLNLGADATTSRIPIIQSNAKVDLLHNEAVKFIHGDVDGDVYLQTLKKWARECVERISQEGSEIPEGYSQGDLYCSFSPLFPSFLSPFFGRSLTSALYSMPRVHERH